MKTFERLTATLKKSDSHHLSILAVNDENEVYQHESGEAFISYRQQGGYFFVIGGVICERASTKAETQVLKQQVLNDFQVYAKQKGKKIIALHCSQDELGFYKNSGYSINQLGSCYSINLSEYTMAGKKFAHLRNKISKACRKGVDVKEVLTQQELIQYSHDMDKIDNQWLAKKGAKALDFMVTKRESVNVDSGDHRVFVALIDNCVQAYVVYSRSFGEQPGWFHNLSRQLNSAPMGTMQAINRSALEEFKTSGERFLHFGFTPMADLKADYEIEGVCSKVFHWIAHFLQKHGDAVYPAKGQRQYKMSWRPQIVSPDYMAIEGGFSVSALLAFLKVTNSV